MSSNDGVCHIKPEYVLPEQVREYAIECVSSKDIKKLNDGNAECAKEVDGNGEPEPKRKRLTKSEKKKLKGQNKSRPAYHCEKSLELCSTLINITEGDTAPECTRKFCRCLHDVQEYMKIKPADLGETCYNFETAGKCVRGLGCRFGKMHITDDGKNIINRVKLTEWESKGPQTGNNLPQDLQQHLRKKTYDFKFSERVVDHKAELYKQKQATTENKDENKENPQDVKTTCGAITDEDIIALLSREKKKIDFKNKLLLSPLTTVGNLPFRRICKEYGADITCGEMAFCTAILQGAPQEWALVKRHKSEDVFGVQLCANNAYLLAKCGQLLEKEIDIDFIDLNLGCPIEMVYKDGAGSGMLRRPKALELSIQSLSEVLTIPLTVKTRMGVYNNDYVAHSLIPKFRDWGASAVTVHGRTKEQRYTKSADWEYIEKCAQAGSPLPIIGNGDVLSYDDYKVAFEKAPNISSVMIGRGALLKPWVFEEIKEQKIYDISSKERFDIIKKYVNYGLEHWGSDNKGVENTRRFLLEWLSFLYRYIPVGLLETPPQRINERPPYYRGRDDLETLMASPAASDWIKISEMLLGPVPDGFQFLPKHKANSYK